MTMSFKQAQMRREVARNTVLRMRADRAERDAKKMEADLRRKLKSEGYRLKKIPATHSNRELFGIGYMVINDRNVVELGATTHEYDASLEDVANFVNS
ncbi:hypothetical protein NLM16_01345 [Bradyrhizobium brasilense]|uniref:hypothetical protein n=1 Tax=Bradyrhizobium brasilense TaxID=1419277 RepID=UPI002877E8CC|nr:hypothetical protein [Bradyrhizobium brasilense]MCP3412740.1 hypothetical protein [Bradyrhizobium brasilense]